MTTTPFQIKIPDAALTDLRERLKRVCRLSVADPDAGRTRPGFQPRALDRVRSRWTFRGVRGTGVARR